MSTAKQRHRRRRRARARARRAAAEARWLVKGIFAAHRHVYPNGTRPPTVLNCPCEIRTMYRAEDLTVHTEDQNDRQFWQFSVRAACTDGEDRLVYSLLHQCRDQYEVDHVAAKLLAHFKLRCAGIVVPLWL